MLAATAAITRRDLARGQGEGPMTASKFGLQTRLMIAMAVPLISMAGAVQNHAANTGASVDGHSLEQQFRDPPPRARPRVWWHWMNGNVTQAGIAKDLAWMKRSGIAGAQVFDVNQQTPQIVRRRVVFATPEWGPVFRFAASEADRIGLELAITSAAGWSETGGPWVSPEDAMKKVVWTETTVRGGQQVKLQLPQPPAAAGPFGNLRIRGDFGGRDAGNSGRLDVYHDVLVLAYPAHTAASPLTPTMTTGDGEPTNAAALLDDDLASGVVIVPKTQGDPGTINITYSSPQTIRTATLYAPGSGPDVISAGRRPRLEASDNGVDWRRISEFALSDVPSTASFPPTTASRFRVVFNPAVESGAQPQFMPPPDVDMAAMASFSGPTTRGIRVNDLHLFTDAKVNQFETKAGFSVSPDYFALDGWAGTEGQGPPPGQVVNLTGRMAADGSLDWTPPEGEWRIVRIGWSLTGKTNHPAPAEATGLEVDKLDGAAVRRYLEHHFAVYREATGADLFGSHGVRALVTDSTEVGAFNWTAAMVDQFKRLRGYDPTPWLPTLTGAIIGSRSDSDKFLYDFRRTIADLHASEHYGTVAKVAHENGLKVYGEALENGRPSLGDDLSMRSFTDYPMAALWYTPSGAAPRGAFLADLRGAASVAHVYGQNVAAAESLTSALAPWGNSPANLKATIDLEFVNGINRPVIASTVLQPVDDKVPGLSLGIFGQYFNRNETWADMAKPWIDYIARNSLMLQQGRNVADVGYFFGEEASLTALFAQGPAPDAPKTSAYDFVNFDALVNQLRNDGADLVTAGGARYRLLYLGGSSRRMSVPALRRIAVLADGGATILGDAPVDSPSLADEPAEFATLVHKLWSGTTETVVGAGRVIVGRDVEGALRQIGVGPDFHFTGGQPDTDIPFVHRRIAGGDSYFVVNRRLRRETIEAHFRVTGKRPELWHADSGAIEAVSYRIENKETVVPLSLQAEDSLHVVFRKRSLARALEVAKPWLAPAGKIETTWNVTFQPGRGAPPSTQMPKLAALNENADSGIRYFSGVATYITRFATPDDWRPERALWLDLGEVRELAEVSINGRVAGTVWHAPYRVNIGPLVRKGSNVLQVRVANLWVNRLIGDLQPDAQKVTYTTIPTYLPAAALRRSGLIGPVQLYLER